MSRLRFLPRVLPAALLVLFLVFCARSSTFASQKKLPPPPPAHAQTPSPAITNEYVHKQFGDNCSVLADFPQFTGDLDGDGVDDLVIAARCKNPMADRDEYSFQISDPYDSFLGFGDVKVTSSFGSDEPERRGMCLLIVHGAEKDAWHADKPKAKFMLINLPFKAITVKRLVVKKITVLGIYMEEKGEGENTTSVVFFDGKKYKYQPLGSTME